MNTCHHCGLVHGTAHYFAVCLPEDKSREAAAGPFRGHSIRKARKDYRCDERGEGCLGTIATGSLYVEGDCNPYRAGGYGHDRVCMACAHPTPSNASTETSHERA